jgi:hypothetical protein
MSPCRASQGKTPGTRSRVSLLPIPPFWVVNGDGIREYEDLSGHRRTLKKKLGQTPPRHAWVRTIHTGLALDTCPAFRYPTLPQPSSPFEFQGKAKIMPDGVFSAAALAISMVSLAMTIYLSRTQALVNARLANLTMRVGLVDKVCETPSVLRFHGISTSDLEAAAITPAEFSYLLGLYEAGSAYFEHYQRGEHTPFATGELRYKMCATADFRRAWPLIKKFVQATPFTDRIEATIRAIQAQQGSEVQPFEPTVTERAA